MLIDTNREKQIEIGRTYPYEEMGLGECLVNNKWKASMGVAEGDIMYMKVSMPIQMAALVRRYNFLTKSSIPQRLALGELKIPCKVKALTSGTYGKLPQDDAIEVNFMEYKHYLELVGRYLPNSFSQYPLFAEYL